LIVLESHLFHFRYTYSNQSDYTKKDPGCDKAPEAPFLEANINIHYRYMLFIYIYKIRPNIKHSGYILFIENDTIRLK
jgi:hypothetical protein